MQQAAERSMAARGESEMQEQKEIATAFTQEARTSKGTRGKPCSAQLHFKDLLAADERSSPEDVVVSACCSALRQRREGAQLCHVGMHPSDLPGSSQDEWLSFAPHLLETP